MNKLLLALGALLAGALLIPDMAEAQRGGRGGGGARMGGGGVRRRRLPGGGGSFGGGGFGGTQDVYSARRRRRGRGRNGQPGLSWCGDCCAPGPWADRGFRQAAIGNPVAASTTAIGNRPLRRALSMVDYGRYPYYGGRNPYYGGYYGGYRTMAWAPGWSRAASSGRRPRTRTTTIPILHIPDAGRVSRWRILRNLRPDMCLDQSGSGRDRMLLPHLGRQSPRHRDRTMTFARRWVPSGWVIESMRRDY